MKFKPEDFEVLTETQFGDVTTIEHAVKRANAKLAEWLKDAPVVYGTKEAYGYLMSEEKFETVDTHKARLVCIEKLEGGSDE